MAKLNITTTPEGNLLWYPDDGSDAVMYNLGDLAWVITATALVSMFVPGLALLYSGLLRRKNALSMLFLCFAIFALGTLHWMLFGYSLAYSDTGGAPFIGDFKWGGYKDVNINPSPVATVPSLLYAIYQSQFEAITMVVMVAGAAERCRMFPMFFYLFCWATIVYCPVAYWTWNARGWLYTLGELDFAGGGPVHIASGFGSFMLSIFLGPRRGYGTPALDYRPQSVTLICLGTGFIWFGWLAFNGASMSAISLKSISCVVNTNLAASAGALTWLAVDYLYTRKYSAVGLCSGILAGMIGITPAVGYVSAPGSLAVGAGAALVSNFATSIKHYIKVDDPVDVGALHGMGGIAGAILTGFFADSWVSAWDGATDIEGGWIDHNYKQMGYQLAGCLTIAAYTSVVSYSLLVVINLIPGCKFRCSEDYEIIGVDEGELGEFAHDYLHLDRDISYDTSIRGRSVEPKVTNLQDQSASPTSTKEETEGNVQPVEEVVSRG
ncbi:hypothetical protein JCM8547_006463 [Rhodosporidiobolus lusitaniae]